MQDFTCEIGTCEAVLHVNTRTPQCESHAIHMCKTYDIQTAGQHELYIEPDNYYFYANFKMEGYLP